MLGFDALTNEELAVLWQDHGNIAARDAILDRFEDYVKGVSISKSRYADKNDLSQEIRTAILVAIDKWRREKGGGVVTMIQFEVRDVCKKMTTLRSPVSGIDPKAMTAYRKAMQTTDSPSEAARMASIKLRHGTQNHIGPKMVARMALANEIPKDYEDPALALSFDPTEEVIERIQRKDVHALLERSLNQLPERERRIILESVIAERTGPEIALDNGISRSRVNQILDKAKGLMRKHLASLDEEFARRSSAHEARREEARISKQTKTMLLAA